MIMMKPKRLLVPALFGVALAFTQSANAMTVIDVGLGVADVTCNASSPDEDCLGYIATNGSPSNSVETLAMGFESDFNSDIWEVKPSNPLNELAALTTILGFDPLIAFADVTVIDTGGADTASFSIGTDVLYWSVKLGTGTAFFKNLALATITNLIDYAKCTGSPTTCTPGNLKGGGISHITLYGGLTVIPLPAALPMFLLALGGLGFVARRRRSAAA